jgi:hypothetical protein
MNVLLVFFGFFAVLSVAALVKFSGNPIFLFTLLLCVASLATVWRADREDRKAPPRGRRTGARRRR